MPRPVKKGLNPRFGVDVKDKSNISRPLASGLKPRLGSEVNDKSKTSRIQLLRTMIKSRMVKKQ